MGPALPGDDRDAFVRAVSHLSAATGASADLCGPFVDAMQVSGGVVSTLGRPLGNQTVCASSTLAARIDEIQIDLGEGPCWEALRTRRPVLEPDLRHHGGDAWPGAREALRQLDVQSLFAFPLFVGALDVGVVDLYSTARRDLTSEDVQDATVLATITARVVLRRALDAIDDAEEGASPGPYSQREVHQATGMVAAQLKISPKDALVVLRGHAFANGHSVREVASDVVARRTTFEP
ncbi:GAF and ANTAR domain-containing protein [Microbacterium sp. W4I20]|uniref:GAF and ANTAR domain-containing protein n=1 Tax=Microbacterium sp. W4I20 TaxID=3042262 RepID=UPI002783AF27|nr:GAF and ANTAR domain-containing protein [Microbacterium sp. W4I20]MDQ0726681.1 hypothetical protein [Microbacterium sp. W4I20]